MLFQRNYNNLQPTMTSQELVDLFKTYTSDPLGTLYKGAVPLNLLKQSIRELSRRFIRDRFWFKPATENISIVAGTSDYIVTATDAMVFYHLERVISGGINLPGTVIEPEYKTTWSRQWSEPVIYFDNNQTFHFVREPTDSYTLKLYFNKRPTLPT